jgi:hypothetical protein
MRQILESSDDLEMLDKQENGEVASPDTSVGIFLFSPLTEDL